MERWIVERQDTLRWWVWHAKLVRSPTESPGGTTGHSEHHKEDDGDRAVHRAIIAA